MGSQRLGHDLATEKQQKQQQNWNRANKQFSLFKMQQQQHGENMSRLLIRAELEMHTMQMGRECWAAGLSWRWVQEVWQPDPAQSHRQLWRRQSQTGLFISILSKCSQRALAAWAATELKALLLEAIIPLPLSMLASLVKENPPLNQNDIRVGLLLLFWLTSLENRALRQSSSCEWREKQNE